MLGGSAGLMEDDTGERDYAAALTCVRTVLMLMEGCLVSLRRAA